MSTPGASTNRRLQRSRHLYSSRFHRDAANAVSLSARYSPHRTPHTDLRQCTLYRASSTHAQALHVAGNSVSDRRKYSRDRDPAWHTGRLAVVLDFDQYCSLAGGSGCLQPLCIGRNAVAPYCLVYTYPWVLRYLF